MTETATPTLATVITGAIGAQLRGVRVALPARVESYSPATQQVSAQPLVLEGYIDESGARLAERLPVINGVPVVFPGAGGFRITFPIAAGDTVLLVFTSSSIDRWLALGGEVDPLDDRRHDISDAIAIPGLRDFAHALTSAPTDTLSIGKDGGPTIEISGTSITIGGGSAEPTVMASSFTSALNILLTAIDVFTKTCTTVPASTPAATLTAAINTFKAAESTFTTTITKVT